jgi:hypothetical protein
VKERATPGASERDRPGRTVAPSWEAKKMLLPLVWVGCAAVIVTAAIRARHHPGALRLGRYGVGVLFVGAGAAVNTFFLLRGDDYARFADGAYVAFVRDTWRSVVVPDHHAWIGLLVAFELAVGVLAVLGGVRTRLAYVAAIGFHVALLSFGWGFYLWSLPMIAALATLLRAERAASAREQRVAGDLEAEEGAVRPPVGAVVPTGFAPARDVDAAEAAMVGDLDPERVQAPAAGAVRISPP